MKRAVRRSRLGLGLALPLSLTFAACAESGGPTQPLDAPVFRSDHFSQQFVEVCKTGPDGSFATFSVTATGGQLLLGSQFTISGVKPFGVFPAACATVWRSTSTDPVVVTVTEIDQTLGTYVQDIVVFGNNYTVDIPGGSTTLNVSDQVGAFVIFKNAVDDTPPPPPGLEGCTPGFWRQPHHYGFWTGYSPDQPWTAAFMDPGSWQAKKREVFDGSTPLGTAVKLGGGEILALARHAVAALLNSTSPSVDYPLTTAQVIDAVNGAIVSGDYSGTKNMLAGYNELGCGVKD